MKRITANGWYQIQSVDIYVEDDRVLRGTDLKHTRTLYPYRYDNKQRAWTNASGVSYSTFRAGYSKGTYRML